MVWREMARYEAFLEMSNLSSGWKGVITVEQVFCIVCIGAALAV
jgi:hypothetical protein